MGVGGYGVKPVARFYKTFFVLNLTTGDFYKDFAPTKAEVTKDAKVKYGKGNFKVLSSDNRLRNLDSEGKTKVPNFEDVKFLYEY